MDKNESKWSKVFLVVLIFLLAHNRLNGQSFGMGGGASLSYFSMNNSQDNYHSIGGFMAQAFYVLHLKESSAFRFELSYHSKGNGYELNTAQEYQINGQVLSLNSLISVKTRLKYIDFKPLFVYRKSIDEHNSIYGCFGPYIGIGVSGERSTKQRYTSSHQGFIPEINTFDMEDITFGSSGSGFDYLDFGFSSVLGYTYKSFYAELSYHIGLNNINAFNNNSLRLMNRFSCLSLGYLIKFDKN